MLKGLFFSCALGFSGVWVLPELTAPPFPSKPVCSASLGVRVCAAPPHSPPGGVLGSIPSARAFSKFFVLSAYFFPVYTFGAGHTARASGIVPALHFWRAQGQYPPKPHASYLCRTCTLCRLHRTVIPDGCNSTCPGLVYGFGMPPPPPPPT